MAEKRIYEDDKDLSERDPYEHHAGSSKLFTQPYDLVITTLIDQIDNGVIHLRQISDRPDFQRKYVWSDILASRLIESILLNVPIPPCYLAQAADFSLDVIDGQQRIFSVYRFIKNQFRLKGLEACPGLNKKHHFELDASQQRKIETYTLRCVVVTNDSSPDIKFDVFERLNTNTVPLNNQELRNSISRGPLINLLGNLVTYPPWLDILDRKTPDKRMRDEELILRYFAFQILGLDSYFTPQKYWLNNAADAGRELSENHLAKLSENWKTTIKKCLLVFPPQECFRRLPLVRKQVINRALMDLMMHSVANNNVRHYRTAR